MEIIHCPNSGPCPNCKDNGARVASELVKFIVGQRCNYEAKQDIVLHMLLLLRFELKGLDLSDGYRTDLHNALDRLMANADKAVKAHQTTMRYSGKQK